MRKHLQRRIGHILCIVLGLYALPGFAADSIGLSPTATTDFQQAIYRANQRVAGFENALEGGNAATIRQAALELQKDPLAVRQVNNLKSDAFKIQLNNEISSIQSQTKALIRKRLAARFKVPENQVTFFEATNPSNEIKVGQDWDVTAKVNGNDVPLDIAEPIVHESFYEAATGKKPPTTAVAKHFSEGQAVEVTNLAHAEAYGGGGRKPVYNPRSGQYEMMSEGGEIISGDKGGHLRDAEQLTKVMEHKSNLGAKTAKRIRKAGEQYILENRLKGQEAATHRAMFEADAQAWEMEQARQYIKQYDRQVIPRLEAKARATANRVVEGTPAPPKIEVHPKVKAGTDILRKVAKGEISMAEARVELKKMDGTPETPESIIRKGSSQIEALEKLGRTRDPMRTGANSPSQDPFVQNVKDNLELKRLERGARPLKDSVMKKPQAQAPIGTTTESLPAKGIATTLSEADQAIAGKVQETLGIGEIPESSSALRKGVTKYGDKGLAVVGAVATAVEAEHAGELYGQGLEAMLKAGEYRQNALKAREAGNFTVADKLDKRAEAYEQEASTKMEKGLKDQGILVGALAVGSTATGGLALGGYGAYKTGEASYGAGKGFSEKILKEEFAKEVAQAQKEGRTPSDMAAKARALARIAGEVSGLRWGMEQVLRDRDAEEQPEQISPQLAERRAQALADLDDGLFEIARLQRQMHNLNTNPNQTSPWVQQEWLRLLSAYGQKRLDLQHINRVLGNQAGQGDGEAMAVRMAVSLLPPPEQLYPDRPVTVTEPESQEEEKIPENDSKGEPEDSENPVEEPNQPQTIDPNAVIELPDVIGMPYADAVTALEAAGLVAQDPELGSDALRPEDVGTVEIAVPAVDGPLHRGDGVTPRLWGAVIASGTVPEVLGMEVSQANEVLEAAGFVPVFELGEETEDPAKEFTVARQMPAAGSLVEAGRDIQVRVFTLKTETVVLPDLRGLSLSQAQTALQNIGLAIAPELGKDASQAGEGGRVYQQTPEPGQDVMPGIAIHVTVYAKAQKVASGSDSKGVPRIDVPTSLVGWPLSHAYYRDQGKFKDIVEEDHTNAKKGILLRPANGFQFINDHYRKLNLIYRGPQKRASISIYWQEVTDTEPIENKTAADWLSRKSYGMHYKTYSVSLFSSEQSTNIEFSGGKKAVFVSATVSGVPSASTKQQYESLFRDIYRQIEPYARQHP